MTAPLLHNDSTKTNKSHLPMILTVIYDTEKKPYRDRCDKLTISMQGKSKM